MIKVSNLVKSFRDIKAVDDLSFQVDKGEVVGFLGPNGAGKTTTMRMLTGYLLPDSGKVEIEEKELLPNLLEFQGKIGYLPENNPLYRDMLVNESLNLTAELKQIKKEDRRKQFDFVVESVGLGDVYYRPVHELSKGYKQRLGMAMALLGEPQIIILDEPTEGLDPNQRAEIRALIKKMAKERTILLSTHVMQEVSAICDRLLIINKGKLVADGTKEELLGVRREKRVLVLELEGREIEKSLMAIAGVKNVLLDKIGKAKYEVKISVADESVIQPEIARLVRDKDWVIWSMMEEKNNLEDIFYKLTQDQDNKEIVV